MTRALLTITIFALCLCANAHLNHVQFATVEESAGKLVVRYRMSADMFQSNLDALIKSGALGQEILRLPIDKMIEKYFAAHLLVDKKPAETIKYSLDEKNGDWVAEFTFAAGQKPSLFCDAFLENNPNTQTLARINWRGEQTVFHFRKANVEHTLGMEPIHDPSPAPSARASRSADYFAMGLRAHGIQAGLLAVVLLLRCFGMSTPRIWFWIVIIVAATAIMPLQHIAAVALPICAVVATANAFIELPERIQL